jgi:excisionase family DNA binding protein
MTEPRQYMRAGELAQSLGVTARTVRRWIATGVIPSVKVGGSRLVPISAVLGSPDLTFLDDFESEDDNG